MSRVLRIMIAALSAVLLIAGPAPQAIAQYDKPEVKTDTKTEKIQFRIVDPPQVPVLPAAPNRPMYMSVVLLFGLGAGLAVPLALTQLDRSFATVGQLRNLGIPIVGSVSRLSLGAARRSAMMQSAAVCASAFLLIAVYGTLLALSVGLHSIGIS